MLSRDRRRTLAGFVVFMVLLGLAGHSDVSMAKGHGHGRHHGKRPHLIDIQPIVPVKVPCSLRGTC